MKDSIPYSQALRIKQICSETSEVIKNLKDLKDAFIKRGYHSKIMDHLFERAANVDRKILLENREKPSTQGNLPLILTYNKTLLNIENVIEINIGISYLSMKIFEQFLIKNHHCL